MSQFLESPLSSHERELMDSFHRRCIVEGIAEFTSDDFRSMGFDRALYGDPQHSIGSLFAKWKHKGFIIDTLKRQASTIDSNHKREVKVYRWR